MALTERALTTLALTKAISGIEGTSQDALVETMIEAISDQVRTFCGREFMKGTYIDHRKPNGQITLLLQEAPVVSISEVTIDGEIITDFILTETGKKLGAINSDSVWTGPYIEIGMTRDFYEYQESIRVEYIAGWFTPAQVGYSAGNSASLPLDLQMAVSTAVAVKIQEISNQSAGLIGLTQGGLSYRWSEGKAGGAGSQWPASVAAVLGQYKRSGWSA